MREWGLQAGVDCTRRRGPHITWENVCLCVGLERWGVMFSVLHVHKREARVPHQEGRAGGERGSTCSYSHTHTVTHTHTHLDAARLTHSLPPAHRCSHTPAQWQLGAWQLVRWLLQEQGRVKRR